MQLFDDETGRPRGAGVLEFPTADLAKKAIDTMHRLEYKGMNLPLPFYLHIITFLKNIKDKHVLLFQCFPVPMLFCIIFKRQFAVQVCCIVTSGFELLIWI